MAPCSTCVLCVCVCQACLQQRCQDVSVFAVDDCRSQCHGHGVRALPTHRSHDPLMTSLGHAPLVCLSALSQRVSVCVCVFQVCNSNRKCHCEVGWAPPDCRYWGRGGSVDSGPASPATGNTRDATHASQYIALHCTL